MMLESTVQKCEVSVFTEALRLLEALRGLRLAALLALCSA
jgi:hypothetical protein